MPEQRKKKSGKTTVDTAELVAIANKLGLTQEPKAGWINMYVQEPGTDKRPQQRLLVHTGKKGTNCIELVGFEVESEGIISHPASPAKTMTQMINCDLEKQQIKRAFYACGKRLVELHAEMRDRAAKAEAEREAEEAAIEVAAEDAQTETEATQGGPAADSPQAAGQ